MSAEFETAALHVWLEANVEGFRGPVSLTKFPGGQSNPTYRLEGAGGALVLRRKPFGPLLPSAHAVDREFRLISALHPTGFPVPRPYALCTDDRVIGAAFYVMELVDGDNHANGQLPGHNPAERRAIYTAMIEGLARLHAIAPESVALGDFGKPGNYFARQVDRWTRQYRASQTDDVPEAERLMEWLPRSLPEQAGVAILHGDYRLDNLIFRGGTGELAAVIDWELATTGDPLADFAYLAMNWVMPPDGRSGLGGLDLADTGIPTLEEATEIYRAASGRAEIPALHWYFAFNLFRLAGICQGIRKRIRDGNASSERAQDVAARVEPLSRAAWEKALLAGAGS